MKTVTLHRVDLAEVERRWRTQTVADAVRARPGGRVATLPPARGTFAHAAAALPPLAARELFEALVEDLATASLHDAPFGALGEVCDRLARLARSRALELTALEAAPLAYPAVADRDGAILVWLEGAEREAAARAAVEAAASPRGSELGRELLEALVPVLAGPVVVAQILAG